MSDKTAAEPRYGLVLDLPGAPAVPHRVDGLEGEFSAEEPRPLEECAIAGELYEIEDEDGSVRQAFRAEGVPQPLSLEQAKKLDALAGMPVALVQRKDDKAAWKRVARRTKANDGARGESEE